MCEHTRRPKLFCILQSCQLSQCCACSICMKQFHNHTFESYLSQKEVADLLTRFQIPNSLKEQRKPVNIKLYKFLTRLKAQITNKLQEIFGDLMSKAKYPFLYKAELLDSYRKIRDKNYQRLIPQRFRQFCHSAKTLQQIDLVNQQQSHYVQYLQQINAFLGNIPEKISSIEKAFDFTLNPDVRDLYLDYIKEIQSHQLIKPLNKSESSNTLNQVKNNRSSPKRIEKNEKDFLTPTKAISRNDVSLDNISLQAISDNEKSSKKSEAYEEQLNLNASLEIDDTSMHRIVRSRTPLKPQETVSIRSNEQKLGNAVSQIYNNSSFSYQQGISKGFSIKISDAKIENGSKQFCKDQNQSLSRSTEINAEVKNKIQANYRKKSFNESMNCYIKERQDNIKKRLDELKIEKNILGNQKDSGFLQQSKINKHSKNKDCAISAKSSASSPKKKSLLQSPPKILKKAQQFHYFTEKKQKKTISKYTSISDAKNQSKNYSILQPNQKKSLSPERKSNNVSLNKFFIHKEKDIEKNHEQIHKNLGNIIKQIPLGTPPVESSQRRKLLERKDSLQTTTEQELQASCRLIAKIQRTTDQEQLRAFLEKFIEKYQNSITGVEYLTFIYLQLGKAKEALVLSSSYLQKLDSLNIKQIYKINLIINKAAALNNLGREKETIAFLMKKMNMIEHCKIHKNMGDAYFHLGDKDNAIYHYQKSTQLNSKYDQAYYNLAVMLYLQESYFNALMNIQKAVGFQPLNTIYLELKEAIKERISNSRAE